jgi:hypothetical protein
MANLFGSWLHFITGITGAASLALLYFTPAPPSKATMDAM